MRRVVESCIMGLVLFMSLTGCENDNRIFEENYVFDESEWSREVEPVFEFTIKDTSVSYHLFYNLRNSVNYPYNNLYLQYSLEDSTGEIISNTQQEMYLFDPKTGEPSGKEKFFSNGSLGDIFDHRYPCLVHHKFKNPGTYIFKVKQAMRDPKPIEGVLSVGLRVETALN